MSKIDARTIECLRREELWNVVPEDRALLLLVEKYYNNWSSSSLYVCDDISDDNEVKNMKEEDPFFTLALAARYNRPHCNNWSGPPETLHRIGVVVIIGIITIVNIVIIAIHIAEVDQDMVDITITIISSALIVLISVFDSPDPDHRCYLPPPHHPHHHFYLCSVWYGHRVSSTRLYLVGRGQQWLLLGGTASV